MSKKRTNSKSAALAVLVGFGQAIFVIVSRFYMATLITIIETLRIANYLTPEPVFSWQIVSFDGSQIATSKGMSVAASTPPSECKRGDMIFVLGSWG